MGQKVHPVAFRLAYNVDWQSKWFMSEKKDFAKYLYEDYSIRKYILDYYKHAFISKTEIERRDQGNSIIINIFAEKPGYLIGRGGEEIDTLIKNLEFQTDKTVAVNITEIQHPELDGQVVARRIAFQLERRSFFRKVMNEASREAMENGAIGIKIVISGRVGGAEMSRREKVQFGNIPLHTLKAVISYGFAESATKYGNIGVKVWIHTGHLTKREFEDNIREEKIVGEKV